MSIHVNGDRNLLVMKGAPERILKVCSTALVDGKEVLTGKKFEKKFVEVGLKEGILIIWNKQFCII